MLDEIFGGTSKANMTNTQRLITRVNRIQEFASQRVWSAKVLPSYYP